MEKKLQVSLVPTPLGEMVAIADDKLLYLLEFADCKHLEREIENLKKKTKATLIAGSTQVISSVRSELDAYFLGQLTAFKTPLYILGSPFQKQVWQELKQIPFGQTRSYLAVAVALNKPTGFRAVAQANSTNKFAIVIPCHRVINNSGELGGYGGGLERKEWLIKHEKQSA